MKFRWAAAARLVASRLHSDAAYERFIWPEGAAPAPRSAGPDWKAEEVGSANLAEYPDPGILEDLRGLLQRGDGGLYVRVGGSVAARIWWQWGPSPVLGPGGLPLFSLEKGEALLHYCETLPAWRGRGLYPWGLQQAVACIHRQGRGRVWILSDPANEASRRGILKAGFQLRDLLEASFRLGFSRCSLVGARP